MFQRPFLVVFQLGRFRLPLRDDSGTWCLPSSLRRFPHLRNHAVEAGYPLPYINTFTYLRHFKMSLSSPVFTISTVKKQKDVTKDAARFAN